MISFIPQLPFLFLISCYSGTVISAVLPETPRSRSTSVLGVVEGIPCFPLLYVTETPSALILPSGNHAPRPRFQLNSHLQNYSYILQSQNQNNNAKTKET